MVASIGTSSTAVGSNDNSQDQLKNRITLWTQDFIACQPLAGFFHIATLGSEQRSGEHVIALEKEREIRLLARTLSATGKTVSVFVCHDPLELSIHTMGDNAAMMILQQKLSYAEWLDEIKEAPLSLEDAVAIAEDIMQSQPESLERTIALETLGRRAKVSEYNWHKNYLQSIKAKLESCLVLDSSQPIDPTERKRLELKAIAQERDPYKSIDLIIEFSRRTGWSRRDIEQQIRLFKTSTTIPKAKRVKGKDFLGLETESISWVFPGIIPGRGVFVLGGHAGAGKTTLAYDAAGSLLLGEEFLGEKPVRTGKVLIVSGDELPCFTQDKLIERGIPVDNEDWEIILNWDVSQWEVLEEAIADIRPALVIIDSFSSIHRDPSFDENSSQAKSTIYDLEALTNAYNCGCILIHHLSKSKENQGVAKLRGSSAISAAASVVCLMDQTSADTRKLSFPKVRGAQTEPFLVTLDGSSGRYVVINGGDEARTKSLGERIFAFLAQDPEKRFEQDEISRALSIPLSQKDSVYQALGRLFKRGQIIKRPSQYGGKRKVYGVANPAQLSHTEALTIVTDTIEDTPPLPQLNVSVQISETIDTQELQLTDNLTDNLTNTELTLKNELPALDDSTQVIEGIPAELTDTTAEGSVCPPVVETVTPTPKQPKQIWAWNQREKGGTWKPATIVLDNGFGSITIQFVGNSKEIKVPRNWTVPLSAVVPSHTPKKVF